MKIFTDPFILFSIIIAIIASFCCIVVQFPAWEVYDFIQSCCAAIILFLLGYEYFSIKQHCDNYQEMKFLLKGVYQKDGDY